MRLVQCERLDPRWDNFVLGDPQGTFFHLLKWKDVLSKSFSYIPYYLFVEEAERIIGVLPLFLVKSFLFGRSLVTMPLAVYGGPVAESTAAETLLMNGAIKLAHELKVRYLEVRGNPYSNGHDLPQALGESRAEKRDLYVTFIRGIDADEQVNFLRIPRKQRRMIRQGQKHGLHSSWDDNGLRDFYRVYAESVRNLGTPVYSYGYFAALQQAFGDQCRILLVGYQEKIIAGVLVFFYKDQILPYYGGALKEYFHLAPSDFMYWELMCYGAGKGYRIFDFGRSKRGSGSFSFKHHWGFEPISLPYFYYRVRGAVIPDTSSKNPRLQWAVRIWRNLPLKLTMTLGPRIVRHIP